MIRDLQRMRLIAITLALVLGTASGAEPPTEPKNLSLLKDEIVAYTDSGRYTEEIAAVAKAAGTWIEERAKSRDSLRNGPGAVQLTVVFDIDETLLSNLPHMRLLDFGYQAAAWQAWVARGEAPVIAPVREVYRTARRLGLEVVLITGRREKERAATEKNLKQAGVGDYSRIFFKSDDSKETSARFKTATRQRLVAEGRVIIANIGDQESDLEGGFAERTFKLPCPFYFLK